MRHMQLALLPLSLCLFASGCCLCQHPYDCCGPVCGQEHYCFARRASAFSDMPYGEYGEYGEYVQEPEEVPSTRTKPAPSPDDPPPPPPGTAMKRGNRSAIVGR
jgi:hypothetical protein